jgi:hypothetical protein
LNYEKTDADDPEELQVSGTIYFTEDKRDATNEGKLYGHYSVWKKETQMRTFSKAHTALKMLCAGLYRFMVFYLQFSQKEN